ncbi:MAG: hypothetical protein CBB68_10965 [Rhodospirillaceae bacterium TMED8]|nr:hypothetical protein [Magnetovibrio sp.]OUT49928.1 MAG: hypothetical protein CBB68_10965 [Rhodospirillaceae bacterium TMED8]
MQLTPEQTEEFEHKMRQLSDFAETLGLSLTINSLQKTKIQRKETSPEEAKISGVRNLDSNVAIDSICDCQITYHPN